MELEATIIAIADEIAGAAELVMGKSDGIPVAIIRGLEGATGDGSARELGSAYHHRSGHGSDRPSGDAASHRANRR